MQTQAIQVIRWLWAECEAELRDLRPFLMELFAKGHLGAARLLTAIQLLPIVASWLSFELYHFGWSVVHPQLERVLNRKLSNGGRLIFCLVCSIFAAHVLAFAFLHVGSSFWVVLAGLMHGIATNWFWDQGYRWGRQQVGWRPSRYYDPSQPYSGLDL